MSYFDHTVVVNQSSLKENNFLCHSNLQGCCSWLEWKFHKINVAFCVFSSNQLHMWGDFNLMAQEQGWNASVRETQGQSRAGLYTQLFIQRLPVVSWLVLREEV